MRIALIVIGAIVLALGIWVTSGHASYPSTDTLVKVGSAQINATHDKAVPQWLGIAGIVIGGLLVVGGIVGFNLFRDNAI
ncbi:MAG: hypothetical protein L0H70_09825, partial [Xanthomonadales bacterium]|nr:hypothetical protein [Xanthomonadales bacterium]